MTPAQRAHGQAIAESIRTEEQLRDLGDRDLVEMLAALDGPTREPRLNAVRRLGLTELSKRQSAQQIAESQKAAKVLEEQAKTPARVVTETVTATGAIDYNRLGECVASAIMRAQRGGAMTEAELQAKMIEAAAEFDRGSAWGQQDRFDAQVAAAHAAAISDIDAEYARAKARRQERTDPAGA